MRNITSDRKTTREILAEVISGGISLEEAAPELRLTMKRAVPSVYFTQEEDGTYTVMRLIEEGKEFSLADMITNRKPIAVGVTEEEFEERYGQVFAFGFKRVESHV